MIEARQAGMKLTDVARRYGISESGVKRITIVGLVNIEPVHAPDQHSYVFKRTVTG